MKYSSKTYSRLSLFFQYRNSVDFFTEDGPKAKELYRTILKRLFEGTIISVNDITPFGCKNDVLKKLKETKLNSQRPAFFIVDGDIDILLDIKNQEYLSENVYLLDRYCIENFLIEKNHLIEFAYLYDAESPREDIEKNIDYENNFEILEVPLINLFLHFAICKKYSLEYKIKNINYFLDKGKKAIDVKQIDQYTEDIARKIREMLPPLVAVVENEPAETSEKTKGGQIFKKIKKTFYTLCELVKTKYERELAFLPPKNRPNSTIEKFDNMETYQFEVNTLKERLKREGKTMIDVVSGKDYLLPLLKILINKQLGGNVPAKSLKLFVAQRCSLLPFENLKKKAIKFAERYKNGDIQVF